jgi:hypothetical protein
MRYKPLDLTGNRPPFVSASTALADRLAARMHEGPAIAEMHRGEVGSEIRPRRMERQEEFTWVSWGQRSEQLLVRVARNLEMVNWAAIGAMTGVAVAAVPAFFLGFRTYPYVFAQPLGAAVGAIAGNVMVWWRWRKGSVPRWL